MSRKLAQGVHEKNSNGKRYQRAHTNDWNQGDIFWDLDGRGLMFSRFFI